MSPIPQNQVMLAALESIYATNPGLVATDAQLVEGVKFGRSSELYRPPISGELTDGYYPAQVGKFRPSLSWKAKVRPNPSALSALVKPSNHDYLVSCGFVGAYDGGTGTWTYVYTPGSAGSLSVELERAGALKSLVGGRGNVVWDLVAGMIADESYAYQGKWVAPDLRGMTTPSYAFAHAFYVQSIGFAPFGDAPAAGEYGRAQKVGIDNRNVIFAQEDVNADQGLAELHIPRRGQGDDGGPQVKLSVTRPAGAAANRWLDRFLQRTEAAACSITLGNAAVAPAQTMKINLARLVVDACDDADGGEVLTQDITCSALRSVGSLTEDALSIVWTQH